MKFTPTALEGSFLVGLEPFTDSRGWFARYYCKMEFAGIGHQADWVQMNHSVTFSKGSLRGLHYQLAPFKEIKLIRCIAGAVYDVIVDIRKESDTFLQWFGTELSADNQQMLYIPEGFAHGFQCLADHCELLYHHSAFYQPDAESGIRYNDPALHIDWPLPVTVISDRDANHPFLDENFKGI